jgi:hypothetical protein
VQRGPAFPEDTEVSLERASGKYHVKTRAHKDGREKVQDGTLDLPPDTYNGMVLTVLKNLSAGAGETVHMVAFTPAPKLIQLELVPAGEQKILVGGSEKTATHYVLKPILGIWLKLFASLLGRMPPDNHAWIVTADVPVFVKFEGPLYMIRKQVPAGDHTGEQTGSGRPYSDTGRGSSWSWSPRPTGGGRRPGNGNSSRPSPSAWK